MSIILMMFIKTTSFHVKAVGTDHDIGIFIQIIEIPIPKKLLIGCQTFSPIPLIIPLFAFFSTAPINNKACERFNGDRRHIPLVKCQLPK